MAKECFLLGLCIESKWTSSTLVLLQVEDQTLIGGGNCGDQFGELIMMLSLQCPHSLSMELMGTSFVLCVETIWRTLAMFFGIVLILRRFGGVVLYGQF